MDVVSLDVPDLIPVLDASFVTIRTDFELLEQINLEVTLVDKLGDGLTL